MATKTVPIASKGKKNANMDLEVSNERIPFVLPEKFHEGFVLAAGANQTINILKKAEDREKIPLVEFAFDLWVDKLWETKAVPPGFETELCIDDKRDVYAYLMVREEVKVKFDQLPEETSKEEAAIRIISASLREKGMNKDEAESVATRFVNYELDCSLKPTTDWNQFLRGRKDKNGDWIDASPEEKDMVDRAIRRLTARTAKEFNAAPLSAEEFARLVEQRPQPALRPGFFERLPKYVNSRDQLKILLEHVKPQYFLTGFKFGESGTEQEKNNRKLKLVEDLIWKKDD